MTLKPSTDVNFMSLREPLKFRIYIRHTIAFLAIFFLFSILVLQFFLPSRS